MGSRPPSAPRPSTDRNQAPPESGGSSWTTRRERPAPVTGLTHRSRRLETSRPAATGATNADPSSRVMTASPTSAPVRTTGGGAGISTRPAASEAMASTTDRDHLEDDGLRVGPGHGDHGARHRPGEHLDRLVVDVGGDPPDVRRRACARPGGDWCAARARWRRERRCAPRRRRPGRARRRSTRRRRHPARRRRPRASRGRRPRGSPARRPSRPSAGERRGAGSSRRPARRCPRGDRTTRRGRRAASRGRRPRRPPRSRTTTPAAAPRPPGRGRPARHRRRRRPRSAGRRPARGVRARPRGRRRPGRARGSRATGRHRGGPRCRRASARARGATRARRPRAGPTGRLWRCRRPPPRRPTPSLGWPHPCVNRRSSAPHPRRQGDPGECVQLWRRGTHRGGAIHRAGRDSRRAPA